MPQLVPAPAASQALSSAEPSSHLESQPVTEKPALSQQLSSKPASAGRLVSGDASDSSLKSARHQLITAGSPPGSKGKRAKTSGQQCLTRFVKQTAICPTQSEPAAAAPSGTRSAAQPPLPPPAEPLSGGTTGPAEPTQRTSQQSCPQQHGGPDSSTAAAKAAWSRIQESAKPPLCSGHQEPCVIREVKKKGPNKGVILSRCSGCPMKAPRLSCNEMPLQVAYSMCAPGQMVSRPRDGATSLPGWGAALCVGNQHLLPPRGSVSNEHEEQLHSMPRQYTFHLICC